MILQRRDCKVVDISNMAIALDKLGKLTARYPILPSQPSWTTYISSTILLLLHNSVGEMSFSDRWRRQQYDGNSRSVGRDRNLLLV
jgi:hypothetical protein